MKRALSLFLTVLLLAGCIPVCVWGEENRENAPAAEVLALAETQEDRETAEPVFETASEKSSGEKSEVKGEKPAQGAVQEASLPTEGTSAETEELAPAENPTEDPVEDPVKDPTETPAEASEETPAEFPEEEPAKEQEQIPVEKPEEDSETPPAKPLAEGLVYGIRTECGAHGELKLNKTTAGEGESVTAAVLPERYWVLSTLLLNGAEVTESVAAGEFTFLMPAQEAVLTAEFTADPAFTAHGSCGEAVCWELTSAGELRVFGTGAMQDFLPDGQSTPPWEAYRAEITSLTVENGVTRLGSGMCKNCDALERVSLPESVSVIGAQAFSGCTALKSISLPKGIKTIEEEAFLGSGITSAALPASLFKLGQAAFSGCTSLSFVALPEGNTFTRIEAYTFRGCASLVSVTIPDTVMRIGEEAFANCGALKEIKLPAYAESLGAGAFRGCGALSSITVPEGIAFAEEGLFEDCESLCTVRLSGTLQEIRSSAFAGCTKLSELHVPESIALIAANAFNGSGLKTLYYRGTERQWNKVKKPGLPEETEVILLGSAQLYEAFYTLSPGQAFPLKTEPEALVNALEWESETPAVCSVENGTITAVGSGTGYITGIGAFSGRPVTARIRIDVTESANAADEIVSVALEKKTLSVKIYYAEPVRFGILLDRQALFAGGEGEEGGALIQAAAFSDKTVNSLFSLRVIDDRTLELSTTAYALENAATLKTSYTSAVTVRFADGSERMSDGYMTLGVSRDKPTLKAAALKLNSYSAECAAAPAITGGRVTSFEAKSLPAWLETDGKIFHIARAYEGKKCKGTVKLNCHVEGWLCPVPVTVSVTAAPVAPSLALSTASVTLNPGTVDTVTVRFSVKNPVGEEGSRVSIGRIVRAEGKKLIPLENGAPVEAELLPETNGLRLRCAATDGKAHTYRVYLKIGEKEAKYITVKTPPAKSALLLKLKKSGAVDTGVEGSAITLIATPAFFHSRGQGESYTLRVWQSKKGTATVEVTELFNVEETKRGVFILKEKNAGSLLPKYTYTAEIGADLTGDGITDVKASTPLTVKHTKKAIPSVTLSLSGRIDPLRYGTKITVTPKLKNCYTYTPDPADLHFYRIIKKTAVPVEEVPFLVSVENGRFLISQKPGAEISAAHTYAVCFEGTLNGVSLSSKLCKLQIKQGTVKLIASSLSTSLVISDKNDTAVFHIGSPDATLRGIERVTLSSNLFTLTALGEGDFALGWQEAALSNRKLCPKAGQTQTLTLSVFYAGNTGTTPNAKLKVKVSFVAAVRLGARIVATARTYLGQSYSAMDCSAFTSRVFSVYDPGMPRGAHLQWKRVRASSRWNFVSYTAGDDIPMGALIFFSAGENCDCGRPHEIHHVAISLGGGKMIDSTDRADINCVSIRSYTDRLTFHGGDMHIDGYAVLGS